MFWNRKPVEEKKSAESVGAFEESVKRVVREVVQKALADTESMLSKLRGSFDLAKHIADLRNELETLRIEKARKDEDFARREREVEHKVGLERKRQEFEMAQAKREAVNAVKEENLTAERKRFEEQMKFHDDRFAKEVGYLKEMLGEMLKRLPSAELKIEEKRVARR